MSDFDITKLSRTDQELVQFYSVYQSDHWLYKINLLRNSIKEYDKNKDFLHINLQDVDDNDFINMLKAELHFTYFQMVETLFELIFALEGKDDFGLWANLSFGKWKANYQRIDDIANRKIEFMDKELSLTEEVKIPLSKYLFYFIYNFDDKEEVIDASLENIKQILIKFAQDFLDRDDYNAYKHSLRLFQSPIRLAIAETGSTNFTGVGRSDDAFTYLGKDENGHVRKISKAFDPERDFRMCLVCYQLISNIINLRKKYFLKENGSFYFFDKVDLYKLAKMDTSLLKFSFTI